MKTSTKITVNYIPTANNGELSFTSASTFIDIDAYDVYEEEVVCERPGIDIPVIPIEQMQQPVEKSRNFSTQTDTAPRYDINDLKNEPEAILHFTGLESYEKFLTVLYSLGPAVSWMKYHKSLIGNISIPNQLFLVLWKLRRYPCDFELSQHFRIPRQAVGNIFITWITFMAKTWSLIDTWPDRKLVDFYMPDNFKRNYPKTRATLDATEVRTDGPGNSKLKQASFSTYKNTFTMKSVLSSTPGGLISHCTPAYGGSASDRQIIERSQFMEKCDPGDVVLADKGILVQDLFASRGVTVTTPTCLVKGRLQHSKVIRDRKV